MTADEKVRRLAAATVAEYDHALGCACDLEPPICDEGQRIVDVRRAAIEALTDDEYVALVAEATVAA